jgi:hypothetical protein
MLCRYFLYGSMKIIKRGDIKIVSSRRYVLGIIFKVKKP